LIHGRTYKPSVSIVTSVGRASQTYSFPARRLWTFVLALPSVAEIEQVVTDDRPAPVAHQRVERVAAAPLIVIEPRGKDRESAQLATVLVRKDVVRIVRTRAGVTELAERGAGQLLAGDDPVAAVGVAGGLFQDRIDVSRPHVALPPGLVLDERAGADRERLAAHRGQIVFRHEVAERVEELRRDDLGGARHLRLRRGIELDEIRVARPVADRQARRDPFEFSRDDRPAAGRRPGAGIRSPGRVRCRPARGAGAIHEPARIGHLVEGVHVHRADRCLVAPVQKRVLEQVELAAGRDRPRARRILRFGIARDRIVAVELRRARAAGVREHQRRGECRRHEDE
jgi:hypothetical protein